MNTQNLILIIFTTPRCLVSNEQRHTTTSLTTAEYLTLEFKCLCICNAKIFYFKNHLSFCGLNSTPVDFRLMSKLHSKVSDNKKIYIEIQLVNFASKIWVKKIKLLKFNFWSWKHQNIEKRLNSHLINQKKVYTVKYFTAFNIRVLSHLVWSDLLTVHFDPN